MLALLSPAKKLDLTPASSRSVSTSQPVLMEDVEALMVTTRDLTPANLSKLMGISDKLAELNHQRFQDFATPFTDDNAKAAVLTFAHWALAAFDPTTAYIHIGILAAIESVRVRLQRR